MARFLEVTGVGTHEEGTVVDGSKGVRVDGNWGVAEVRVDVGDIGMSGLQ